jgi:hypothetical protein
MTEERIKQLERENESLRYRLQDAENWRTKLTVALFVVVVGLPLLMIIGGG